MYLDKQLMFSEAQALTATAASTNVLDLGPLALGTGPGEGMRNMLAFCTVHTILDSAGDAATLVAVLQMDSTAAFSSAATIATTGTIAEATLVAKYKIFDGIRLPLNCERYIRINFTVAVENFTSGNIDAGLTNGYSTSNIIG